MTRIDDTDRTPLELETELETAPTRVAELTEQHAGRFVLLITSIWLIFLLFPMVQFADRLDEPAFLLSYVLLVPFVAAYLAVFELARRQALTTGIELSRPLAWLLLGGMGLIVVVLTLVWGESGLALMTYVVIAAPFAVGSLAAAVWVVGLSVVGYATSVLVGEFHPNAGYLYVLPAIGLVMWGVKQILLRNVELITMRREYRNLLLEQERNRFARDLHDLLGHSLTAITVKAELARRLMETDVDRAAQQLEDLERLGREALSDVREAVQGFHQVTLTGELTRARMTLAAAGIDARLPSAVDVVDPRYRELFAWVIREGVTNVVRHAAATYCAVEVHRDRIEVRNDCRDGVCASLAEGSGLRGLQERAHLVGATVRVHQEGTEVFVLEVGAA